MYLFFENSKIQVNNVNRSILHTKLEKNQGLAKLTCMDYGFECNFFAEGDIEDVIDKFRHHTEDEHGIDYSKEAIMQVILRKAG